jgi:hypothetical protein
MAKVAQAVGLALNEQRFISTEFKLPGKLITPKASDETNRGASIQTCLPLK